MSNISKMTGAPWHVNKFTRQDGDDKRHRSRCKNYKKSYSLCLLYQGRCRGAAYCKHYQETEKASTATSANLSKQKERDTSKKESKMRKLSSLRGAILFRKISNLSQNIR